MRGATNSFRRQFSIERFEQTAKIALPLVAAAATGESRRRSMSYYQNPPVSPSIKTVPMTPSGSHLQRAGAAAVGDVVRPLPRAATQPVTNARRASREAISRTTPTLTPIKFKKRGQVGAEMTTPEHAQGPPTKPTATGLPHAQNPAPEKSPVKEQLVSLLGALTTVLKVAQQGSLGQVHQSNISPKSSPRRATR